MHKAQLGEGMSEDDTPLCDQMNTLGINPATVPLLEVLTGEQLRRSSTGVTGCKRVRSN